MASSLLPFFKFWRTGLPVSINFSLGKNRSIPSYATHIFLASSFSSLLVTPAKPFCSCNKIGTPILAATFIAAPLAYPPTPIPTSGRKSRTI